MKKQLSILLMVFILLLNFGYAYSEGTAEVKAEKKGPSLDEKKTKAKELVLKAIDFYKKNGKEKAFAAFVDPKGEFIQGKYYIFACDFTGVCLVHGGTPKMAGKSLMDLKDPDGVPFIKNFTDIAKSAEGEGWGNYKWNVPNEKGVFTKTTFIKKVDADNYFGCGFYIDYDEK